MTPAEIALLFGGGILAGIINTMAGGGGLIALPLLLWIGLPASVANGTYRLAVGVQNVFAVSGFERRGVHAGREALPLVLPTVLGGALGASLGTRVSENIFELVLAVVLALAVVPLFLPRPPGGTRPVPGGPLAWAAAFGIGLYGGFVQVGVGFLYLAVLAGGFGLDLVRANAVKVALVLAYTVFALALFAKSGRFAWEPAVALAAGNAVGGWAGSQLAVRRGDRWIRWVVVLAALATAARLLGWLPGS